MGWIVKLIITTNMRLKSLYIKDYKILQDFSIDFSSNMSVLIGENGSGKSSMIECLAYIFGHLHKYFVLNDKTSEFIDGYKINYTINDLDVYIESHYKESKTNTFDPVFKINGMKISTSKLKDAFPDFAFLPSKVVMSYSGITERLKLLSEHFEDKFIKKIIRHDNPYSLKPLVLPSDNPFIYIKEEYISFIILALFVLNTEESYRLLSLLGIDIHGCTTTITLKKPSWAKNKKNDEKQSLPWGMRGKIVEDLLTGLNSLAINKKNEQDKESDRLQYELYGLNMVQDLFGSYYELTPSQVVLFLNSLLCNDLLESVNVTWNKDFSIDKLSEGEKQLILSIGLSLVLNQSNILFLLDEPDVSLHPKLQQDFITNFTNGLNEHSMAIITTHSPSLASDLENNSLYLIRNGKVITKSFKYYGKTVNDILCDYFGLESTRNKSVTKKIEDLWNMIQYDQYCNDEFIQLKNDLEKIIGKDDLEILAMNRDILRKSNEKNK